MALPLLLPLLGAIGAAGVGAQRGRQQRAAEQQASEARGQATVDAIRGAGFGVGPTVGTTPAEQQRLGAISRNIMAGGEFGQQAFGQLEGMAEASGIDMTPQERANLQATQLSNARATYELGNMQNQASFEMAQQRTTAERQLRDAYYTDVAPAVESLQSLNMAMSQMEIGTPAAAFNSARLFTRQLDQSMFASQELTTLIQQSGVAGQYANLVNMLSGKGAFDETTRREMVGSMQAIQNVLNTYARGKSDEYRGLAERSNMGLNPENVVTPEAYSQWKTIQTGGAEPPALERGGVTIDGVTFTPE